ncbi:DUF7064 domain-containing protein [Ilumatobacter sp.]|uniref:DUF7064 domain-containing protein n=1 Tax=Ilumatobacter sp. TaxID=1967498 RepID=UPI003B527EBB
MSTPDPGPSDPSTTSATVADGGAEDPDRIVTVLEPADEYTHTPDAAENYNESMYLNAFDLGSQTGAWFRLGNRVNEGHAEMTVCIYLPGGRVAFMYDRPKITTNDAMDAGGLTITVVEPFEHLTVRYSGKVCLLDDPSEMADPRSAFRSNPMVGCTVELDHRGVSPMYGGKPQHADGREVESVNGFAKAHYEQHCAVTGTITVDDPDGGTGTVMEIDGLGLRDKSWGPRYWQAVTWYRWLPMMFGDDFAMMLSVVDRGGDRSPATSGMVLVGDEYVKVVDCRVEADYDERGEQTTMRAWARTEDDREYEVTGEVLSMIPLRNRRTTPDGEELTTRITEAMTRYECDGRVGIGMSEFLDQVVDGWPIGVPRP